MLSEALNDMDREVALFNLITVTDDDLNIAVVSCLFVVPLDELSLDELN
jgi:hypothetical protein